MIQTTLIPMAESLGATLSEECPLHPSHDHLLHYEQHKKSLTGSHFRCGLCGKIFKSEHYLDRHFDRRHADAAPPTADTCLGDFCDFLRCPSWLSDLRRRNRDVSALKGCKAAALDARRHYCQHLMHDCFLPSGAGSDLHAVFDAMDEAFCEPVSCSSQQRLADGFELPFAPHHMRGEEGPGGTYYVFGGVLIGGLCLLYVLVFCWYSEASRAPKPESARAARPRGSESGAARGHGRWAYGSTAGGGMRQRLVGDARARGY